MKAARRRRGGAAFGDQLSTSFLDVLSNGLGVGILLMVLIAAIPIVRPAVPVPNAPYIRAEWRVAKDPGAILLLRLIPPNGQSYDLDLRRHFDGKRDFDGNCSWPGVSAAGRTEVYGFTVSGVAAAIRPGETQETEYRSFVLWISEPKPGPWRLAVFYVSRSDSLLETAPDAIDVTSMIEFPGEAAVPKEHRIKLGEAAESDAFAIAQYEPDDAEDRRGACPWL